VPIAPVSGRIPCEQGIFQGILDFQRLGDLGIQENSPELQHFCVYSLEQLTGNSVQADRDFWLNISEA
jgi:hypothetical protein